MISPGGLLAAHHADPRPADVRRIAVLRAGGLGDLLFIHPALDALGAAFPDAELTLIGPAWQRSLVVGRPGPVDRHVPLPLAAGVHVEPGREADPAALQAFIAAARAERYDLAVQLHGGGRHSNPFVRRLGARLTIGLRTADAEPLDRSIPYLFYQSEVMRALEVVALVGAAPVTVEPRLAVTDADRLAAARALRPDGRAIALLNPGATDPRRRWPTERFAAVGDALARDGARVVVSGGSHERGLASSVATVMREEATVVAGELTLPALVGLLARAAVVVSNDSGPLHAAAAVGTATVGIFWCGNVITAGSFSRRRHRPVISWQLACSRCGVDCTVGRCEHPDSFVARVPVEEVLAPTAELFATERTDRADVAGIAGSAQPAGERR